MFSSILAEAKGKKAPAKKVTTEVKSTTAPKRAAEKATSTAPPASPSREREATTQVKSKTAPKAATAKATSTAPPASPFRERAVTQQAAPIPQAPSSRSPRRAQSNSHSKSEAPRQSPSRQATRVNQTKRSEIPLDELIAELNAPHPLMVKQAAARQQRRDHGRRQRAPYRVERRNAPHMQQRRAFNQSISLGPRIERKPKRSSRPIYEMKLQWVLLDEARFRQLELDSENENYLVEVLVLDDEAYAELMDMLGNRVEALEFARGEIKQYNQELRRKRAEKETARQLAFEKDMKRRQEERAHEENLASEKRQAEKRAKELKEAALAKEQEQKKAQELKKIAVAKEQQQKKAQEPQEAGLAKEQEQRRKRKSGDNTDSGYSSKVTSSPGTIESSDAASPKGKKRARSNDDAAEDSTPSKKAKPSKLTKVAPRLSKTKRTSPAPTKPVKSTTKKATQANKPAAAPTQASRPRTRRTYVVEDSEDEEMEDADADADAEDEGGLSDFIVDDIPSKPKHKSKLAGMAKSGLFAGFR